MIIIILVISFALTQLELSKMRVLPPLLTCILLSFNMSDLQVTVYEEGGLEGQPQASRLVIIMEIRSGMMFLKRGLFTEKSSAKEGKKWPTSSPPSAPSFPWSILGESGRHVIT
uniref:Uncharacterized protein n=1 Tax=Opuntia streptacantha TaxID=393608 RepID=A0A7C9F0F8_OPUST